MDSRPSEMLKILNVLNVYFRIVRPICEKTKSTRHFVGLIFQTGNFPS